MPVFFQEKLQETCQKSHKTEEQDANIGRRRHRNEIEAIKRFERA